MTSSCVTRLAARAAVQNGRFKVDRPGDSLRDAFFLAARESRRLHPRCQSRLIRHRQRMHAVLNGLYVAKVSSRVSVRSSSYCK